MTDWVHNSTLHRNIVLFQNSLQSTYLVFGPMHLEGFLGRVTDGNVLDFAQYWDPLTVKWGVSDCIPKDSPASKTIAEIESIEHSLHQYAYRLTVTGYVSGN